MAGGRGEAERGLAATIEELIWRPVSLNTPSDPWNTTPRCDPGPREEEEITLHSPIPSPAGVQYDCKQYTSSDVDNGLEKSEHFI